MQRLEAINGWDITSDVIEVRKRLGIPDQVELGRMVYLVHQPHQIIVFEDTKSLHGHAAKLITGVAEDYDDEYDTSIPTGRTQEVIYSRIRDRTLQYPDLRQRMQQHTYANLDEGWPVIDENYQNSYHAYTEIHFVGPLDLDESHWIIPDGRTNDPMGEVARVDRVLKERKRALSWLGIGPDEQVVDGMPIPPSKHIAFIPEDTLPSSGVLFVEVDYPTRHVNSEGKPDEWFTHAITQGPSTILDADKRLLIAKGPTKPKNVARVLFEPVTTSTPASLILLAPQTTIFLDIAAASLIQEIIDETLP